MTLYYVMKWRKISTDSTVELFTDNSQPKDGFDKASRINATRFMEAD